VLKGTKQVTEDGNASVPCWEGRN